MKRIEYAERRHEEHGHRKFIVAKDMASWCVLNITRVSNLEIETFALQLHRAANGMGKLTNVKLKLDT
jgi:hypothetical protein